jgi:hypothetical protein
MAIDHALTMTTVDNAPAPVGTPADPDTDNPTSINPWSCEYPCTVEGHTDTISLIWDGYGFSLPDFEANDINYGAVNFTYVPPLV